MARDVRDCAYIGMLDGGPRAGIVSETETMGPAHVIWLHAPEVVNGYLVESRGYLYSCPTPRPPSTKNG